MLDMTDEQKKLFYTGGVFKDYTMSFDDIGLVITNDTLHQEAVTIKESIIEDNEFVLGGCIASSIEFEVSEIIDYDLNGLEFTVNLALSEGSVVIPMGKYRVNSAKRVDDKDYKRVIGYDALYDASIDVSSWYAGYFANGATHTVKETREALLTYLGIPFVSQNLVNDSVILSLTADTSVAMPGTTILKSLCVLNGGFGKINRYGKFVVSFLGSAGLFPEDTLYPEETLYPEDNFANLTNTDDSPHYRETSYEEYEVKPITALIIQSDSEDAGVTIGSDTSNPYIIRSNFLLYGKTSDELQNIGTIIFNGIKGVAYRPNTTTLDGLPYIEAGDVYTLIKRTDKVESYVFSRTLTGVQALKDTYESKGEELRTNDVSVAMEIQRLQSKTSDLEESIEETKEDLELFKEETTVKFETTEYSIEATVAKSHQVWDTGTDKIDYIGYGEPVASSQYNIGDYYLNQETGKSYVFYFDNTNPPYWKYYKSYKKVTENLQSQIIETADEISAEVTRATNAESSLSSRISITSNEISAEVTRATNAENSLSSRISVTASEISSKVSKGDVVSEINQSADTITLSSGRLVITSGNFTLDRNGNVSVTGDIEATSGRFGDWNLGSGYYGGMYAGDTQNPASNNVGMWLGKAGIRFVASNGSDMTVSSSGASFGMDVEPTNSGQYDLGSSSAKWNNIYASNGEIQTSDRNQKIDIADMPEEYAIALIDGAQPKTYKMLNGSSGRTHAGMISQDIEKSLYDFGMTDMDFAGFIKYRDKDGIIGYGLRYAEFIAPLIKYCQCLKRDLTKEAEKNQKLQFHLLNLQGEFMILKQQGGI